MCFRNSHKEHYTRINMVDMKTQQEYRSCTAVLPFQPSKNGRYQNSKMHSGLVILSSYLFKGAQKQKLIYQNLQSKIITSTTIQPVVSSETSQKLIIVRYHTH